MTEISLARLDAVRIRWNLTSADCALIVIVLRRQKVSEVHLELAECAR